MTTDTIIEDKWSAKDYVANAAFVPKFANIIVDEYLRPASTDTILDLGCGDGKLTAELAAACKYVHGSDSSASMIKIAVEQHKLDAVVQDGRTIDASTNVKFPPGETGYDKVFSNAALHWILCTNQCSGDGEEIRQKFFNQVYKCLKPNGVFASESGGLGNVSEIHSAFLATLVNKYGFDAKEAAKAGPWFFPHEDVVRHYLENAGFKVEKIDREYRSTLLPHNDDGMMQWLEIFGFAFVDAVQKKHPNVDKTKFLQEVLDVLRAVNYDSYSNQWYAGYVRLRFRAVKGHVA